MIVLKYTKIWEKINPATPKVSRGKGSLCGIINYCFMNDYIKMNRDAYNAVADLFSSTRQYLWDDMKDLGTYVKMGDRVLDLGCANGRLHELFEQATGGSLGVEYVGLDQSEELIAIAKKAYRESEFVVGEMCALPFDDDSFDAVYCIAVFCHLPPEKHEQVLTEMKRVLKPGGYLIMTNWNAFNDWVQDKVNKGKYTTEDQKNFIVPWWNGPGDVLATRYYYGFDLEELQKLFEKQGFDVLEHYYAKKGERVGIELGENIVSVMTKKKQ